jgi:hypothetical protein
VRILALVPALLLISIVLSLGGLYWWTDAPWLGWALAAAVLLLAAAIINEGDRSKPLLYLEWMGSAGILRFAAVAGIAATTRRTGTSAGAGKQSLSRGLLVLLEQLDAQRGLLSADLSLVQASNDRRSATVSLFQALGGGWTE